jgi:hypothetical protein
MKAKVSSPDAVAVKSRTLNKDQLHSEDGFIRYCTMGYNEQARRLETTQEFLAAAERERLIIPILEEGGVKFYSPHQLAMVVALRKNVVKNGRLESEEQMAWSQAQPVRTLLWGSNLGVTVVADTGKPIGSEPYLNDFPRAARVLDSFLRLVHSYPQVPHAYTARAIHRQRMFNGAPVAYFDFSELTKYGEAALKPYGLTINDLVFCQPLAKMHTLSLPKDSTM